MKKHLSIFVLSMVSLASISSNLYGQNDAYTALNASSLTRSKSDFSVLENTVATDSTATKKWHVKEVDFGGIRSRNPQFIVKERDVFEKMKTTDLYQLKSQLDDFAPSKNKRLLNTYSAIYLAVVFGKPETQGNLTHNFKVSIARGNNFRYNLIGEMDSVFTSSTYVGSNGTNITEDSIYRYGYFCNLDVNDTRLGFTWLMHKQKPESFFKLYGGVGFQIGLLAAKAFSGYYYSTGVGYKAENDTDYYRTSIEDPIFNLLVNGVQEKTKLPKGYSASLSAPVGISFHLLSNFFGLKYLDMGYEIIPTYTYLYLPDVVSTSFVGLNFSGKLIGVLK